jgi:solute carrier family 45, member 1/2/4
MGVLLPKLVSLTKAVSICHLWIGSLGLFGIAMLGTFLVLSSFGSVVLFSVVGFSWAASAWIPYALLGAETSHLSEMWDDVPEGIADYNDNEIGNKSHFEGQNDISNQLGLVYGIHNFFICLPQILMCLGIGIVSILSDPKSEEKDYEKSLDSVWILRLGGILALVAMYISTRVKDPFQEGSFGHYIELDQDDK